MDLAQEMIGSEGEVKLSLEAGKLILKLSHVHASGTVSLEVKEDAKYFLEKLKAAIPGSWDDLVIGAVEEIIP